MPRANTPQDPLAPLPTLAPDSTIPKRNQPKFKIGQVVEYTPDKKHFSNRKYHLKLMLKVHGKRDTRKILDFLTRATGLEISIAGIEPYYALPTIMIVNQCYLENGQCHSGLIWRYKLLIKGELDGKFLCFVSRFWIGEQNLKLIDK